MNKLIYFHGFGSSGEGSTVRSLRELLPEWKVLAPDIPVDPAEALPFLRDFCKREQPNVIVGTSMGGMYAQQMNGFKRICVNPAFDISKHNDILKEGIFEFFAPRMNGEKTFTITKDIIQHFVEMETHQFDGVTDYDKKYVFGLFAESDTTVNCEPVFLQHYTNIIHFHGGHRLDRKIIQQVVVPLILELVRREYRWEDSGYTYVFRLDRQSASFEEIDRLDFSRYLFEIDVQGLMRTLHITDLGQLAEEVKSHFSYGIMEHFLKEHGIKYSTYSEAYFD
jgi:hypothetical protein